MPSERSANASQAALRRAIIAANPDYFSWPAEAQERYRVNLPDEDDFRIRQTLLKALFDIRVDTKAQMDAAFDDFSLEQYLLFNSAILPLQGIGEDDFFLNDYLGQDKTILDFETLSDYDYFDYQFQEQAHRRDDPDYVPKPYRGSLYYRWARLRIDGAFYYANLTMAAGYLYGLIEETGFDKIGELIPHHYVDGPEHGKREGTGMIFDQWPDAGGREAYLEELRERFYRYLFERYDTLLEEFDHKAQKRIYLVDGSETNNPQIVFIFTDNTALQSVRLRHFMRDCRDLMGDHLDLKALAEQVRVETTRFLDEAYQDILKNFDPKVVRLRKKRKVVFADSALKDLGKGDD